MRLEDYPHLLINKKLISPIDLSIKKLEEISAHIADHESDVMIHGLFVMAVSSTEFMIYDVLEYFLICFPEKLPNNEFKFEKDIFFDNYFTLLRKAAESHMIGLSYKSFEEYIKKALEHLSIEWADFFKTFGDNIKEIRATRNLLLHNNLIVNDQYINTAGSLTRESNRGKRLIVDKLYLKNTVETLLSFEDEFKLKLLSKYKDYSKISANKRLWSFIFTTPVMPYDDFWEYDEKSDRIYAMEKGRYEDGLSNSETIFLSLWRAHFNWNSKDLTRFNMVHFDSQYQDKILFFLSVAAEFPFE